MPLLADRVQETTTTGGTGTLTLGGAVTGYRTFAASFSVGNVLFYTIDNGAGEWEIGIGTLVTSGTLSRDTVIESSNSNALVNFSSGTKRVFCSAPTQVLLPNQTSNSGKVLTTDGSNPSWTSTLNSMTIGNLTPGSGAFTTLSASSTVSGTGFSTYLASPPAIGGTTPAAGNFTTLGATGNVTLGDASGDTVTFNAATVTLNNSTTISAASTKTLTLNGGAGSNGLVLDASNNVGIGTASPSGYKLNVNGSASCCGASPQASYTFNANGQGIFKTTTNWNFSGLEVVRNSSNTSTPRHLGFLLDGDSNSSTTIGDYPAIWGIYSSAPTTGSTSSGLSAKMGLASYAGFNFYTNGTQAMTLDASGNLLVGLTTTSAYLDGHLNVQATGTQPGICAKTDPAGNATQFVYSAWAPFATGNNVFMSFETETSATVRGSISYNRSLGQVAYNITSDQRLKTNVEPSGSAIQSILDFPVDQFDWIDSRNHVSFGAVAQKAINVIPEMVTVPANEDEMWSIDWSKAVPRLIKTIQELSAELNELKAKVNA